MASILYDASTFMTRNSYVGFSFRSEYPVSGTQSHSEFIFLTMQLKSENIKRKASIRVQPHRDLFLCIISAVSLLVVFNLVPASSDQSPPSLILQFICGSLLCPALFLFLVRHLYLTVRRYSWRLRRHGEQNEVDALRLPADVLKPESFDGVHQIHLAQHRLLPQVPDSQGNYRARALTIYVAPAIAVLLTSMALVTRPPHPFAAGLIFSQAVLMFWIILSIINDDKPTAVWIERRTRGELMRREQYLCLARVGPYHEAGLTRMLNRIARIETAGFEELVELVSMEHSDSGDKPTWLEHLASHPESVQLLSDLPERIATYQNYRIGKQIGWMRSARRAAVDTAKLMSWILGTVILLTICLAFANAALLFATGEQASPDPGLQVLRNAIGLSIFLPALTSTVMAMQSVFNLRYLAENYHMTETVLDRFRGQMITLQNEIAESWPEASEKQKLKLQNRFQKLVLRTEAALTEEYLRWRFVTRRDAHEFS